ncbi:sensor histidine kinase KdpD [Thermosulfurimonas sp. F29]|uniref:sensor histidine kinase n=1 Tax=Thermosulfurimonas sp. F29 TaxID=2867247 RepID=UPI001C83C709|nr:HAMP domain-containing sensor histidine kinase [Thermosulfurimonas sp. F29]MBX6422334.1 HAMP domain-containing histidine kinase [Thermosulfurimonas sp. F29]
MISLFRRKKAVPPPAPPEREEVPRSFAEATAFEDLPWPLAAVDQRRRVVAVSKAMRVFFPAPEPQNLLELPFPGLVEFHERVFREGRARVEFEWQGRWWRLEGERIREDRAVIRLIEITREVRLSEKNRLLSATLAHEFRTPLTAIRGYAEALEEYLPEQEFPRKALSAILSHTERLSRLVRDLLLLSSLETGLEPRLEPLKTGEVADSVASLLAPLLEKKRLRLEVEGPRDVVFRADPDYLIQALVKVLENAVRFSPEGGSIRLEIEREGTEVVFRVRDEGPGISEDLRERIFEPFFREGPGRGLGLGLALARRIAEAHGGTLSAEASPRGAVMVFRFPANVPGDSQKVHNPGGR